MIDQNVPTFTDEEIEKLSDDTDNAIRHTIGDIFEDENTED